MVLVRCVVMAQLPRSQNQREDGLMNYEQLYYAIQNYAESDEQLFVQSIPTFVYNCEERVYNAVQIPAIRKNVTGNFTNGDSYLALPSDYLASFSLVLS